MPGTKPPEVSPTQTYNSPRPPNGAQNGDQWTNPANNLTLTYNNGVWAQTNVGASASGVDDNTALTLGTDDDSVLYPRASALNANTTVAGVLVGTPVTPALAANSLIISNITADGDIEIVAQTGGNSQAYVFIDSSAGTMSLMGAGVAVAVASATSLNIPNNILLTLGTGGDIALVDKSTSTNANTALTNVVVGTPVTPAVAADTLFLFNKTNDGDLLIGTATGGNSQAAIFVDASAGLVELLGAGVPRLDVSTLLTVRTGGIRLHATEATKFGFGTGEAVTIASGVATVTKPFVVLDAEGAGTTDQLDTITYDSAAAGDFLLLTVNATDTITVDDANINLGAATRAIAPGGALLLYYDGTEWTELVFITATDNA